VKKALYKSTGRYARSLAKNSREIEIKFDPDLIHALRTGFKKMRALLRWQRTDKKIYKPFKKIYDAAGEIRIIQVAKEMLRKERQVPQVFKNWLSLRSVKKKKKWNSVYHKKTLIRLQQKINHLRVRHIVDKHFFQKRIKQVVQIISTGAVPDETLHDARKLAKDMQYVLEWSKKKDIRKTLAKNITVSQLKNTGKQIGRYNDTRMLLLLLTAYIKQETNKRLISGINPMINKWQRNKTKEKEKLIQRLRHAWFPVVDNR
jgi:CHAD domain-containing protein